ncbi:MAG: DUF308 domain-containing protein [Firmicutes bacterium]|nr:DUF308 domain-containing protein [Bacillota bacterium]
MTQVQRVKDVLFGVVMILAGAIFCIAPNECYPLLTAMLCLGMTFRGIKLLFFYFRMARFMVDGRSMLYQAVIMIDLGLFTGALTQVPLMYVMLYLIAIHMFTGGIDVLRALEAKKMGSHWKVTMGSGIVNILLAILCLVFIKVTSIAVMIYAVGLIYAGVIKIITAFRKTTMVYIQ